MSVFVSYVPVGEGVDSLVEVFLFLPIASLFCFFCSFLVAAYTEQIPPKFINSLTASRFPSGSQRIVRTSLCDDSPLIERHRLIDGDPIILHIYIVIRVHSLQSLCYGRGSSPPGLS